MSPTPTFEILLQDVRDAEAAYLRCRARFSEAFEEVASTADYNAEQRAKRAFAELAGAARVVIVLRQMLANQAVLPVKS